LFGETGEEGGEGGEEGGREEGEGGEEEAAVLSGAFVVHVLKEGIGVTGGREGGEDKGGSAARGEARPIVGVDTHLDEFNFFGQGERGGTSAAAAAGGEGCS
jgi:hypothetical protein